MVGTTVPTRTNTGVYPLSQIPRTTDTRTTISGSTVEVFRNKTFPNAIVCTGQNKSFYNCLFEGRTGSSEVFRAYDPACSNLYFEDCTFEQPESLYPRGYVGTSGGKIGIRGHHITMLRCQIRNCVDGFRPRRSLGGDAAFFMNGCWVDELLFMSPDGGQANGQSHNDVMQDDQTSDQSNVHIKGCWLAGHLNKNAGQADFPASYDAAGNRTGGNLEYPSLTSNACIQFAKTGIKASYEFDKNWMFGGSVIFNCGAGAGDNGRLNGLRITNNRIGRDMRLGESWVLLIAPAATPVFTGNVYYDNGAPANIRHAG